MSITFDQFEVFLERHEKRLEQFQMRILEKLTQQMNLNKNGLTDVSAKSHADCIIDSIHEFHFDGVAGVTFESWYKKYEDVFNVDLETFDDAAKVRVLLRKLGTIEHERYTNYILPKNPRDISFEETVKILSQIFGEQSSLFNIRYQCLKIVKAGNDDWVQHASIINRECERFKLSAMTEDQFKCLVFVCSLQSSEDADIRTRILSKIEQCPNITLQEVTTECQRLVNLKHDTSMVENNGRLPYVQAVSGKQKQNTTIKKPPSACWFCGELHYKRFCPYKNYRCTRCQLKGHKETCCKKKMHRRSSSVHYRRRKNCSSTNRIMVAHTSTEHNRRKYVTLEINGRRARLQLDTASDISLISRKTWSHIGKPSVLPTTQLAHSASGGKLNIVGEIYCPVKKGNVQKNVKVYLTESPGLDLLGLDLIEMLQLANQPINHICSPVRSDALSRLIGPQAKHGEDVLIAAGEGESEVQAKNPWIFEKKSPPKKRRKPVQEYQTNDRGEKVLVKYQDGQKWEPGVIVRRIGKVLYLVRGRDGKCTRHMNQIKRDHRTAAVDTQVPFHILVEKGPKEGRNQRLEKLKSESAQPIRVMNRKTRTTTMLQENPKRNSYVTDFKGGGVRTARR
ncbi:unnamed protein product [Schistosoma rodhaini]|nr:unnamed protein product [Schistosoma rodhaini]